MPAELRQRKKGASKSKEVQSARASVSSKTTFSRLTQSSFFVDFAKLIIIVMGIFCILRVSIFLTVKGAFSVKFFPPVKKKTCEFVCTPNNSQEQHQKSFLFSSKKLKVSVLNTSGSNFRK